MRITINPDLKILSLLSSIRHKENPSKAQIVINSLKQPDKGTLHI